MLGTGKADFPNHEGLIVYHAPTSGYSMYAVSLPFGKELFSCRDFCHVKHSHRVGENPERQEETT